MMIRIWGAILILAGCGGFGALICISYKREEEMLRQLIQAINHMQCELQFRLTPLPDLCLQASSACTGIINKLFIAFSDELNQQVSADVISCFLAAKQLVGKLPGRVEKALNNLSQSLGKFDAQGQLQGLESARIYCTEVLETMGNNRDTRLRSYQTLGICSGAALIILLV